VATVDAEDTHPEEDTAAVIEVVVGVTRHIDRWMVMGGFKKKKNVG